MSVAQGQPANPAVKDDNLRLTLAREEAQFIATERRVALRRVAGALVASLIIVAAGLAVISHLAEDWTPLEGPWNSLPGFAAAVALTALVPVAISLVLGLVRLVRVRRYRSDLEAFLAGYNRTLP
ncbi:MAG: hypothetical protein H6907_19565 [Hyphomicrobiales bacterium]|nr:hypothetical protein [Hyphomicrobiales bacterium]MCP5373936.1 hypothetical protein [Hyphomicrobiales bacterium]